jgi:biotin/methionine sulfoxide reductase
MMGLAHTLVSEGLADLEFLNRYTVGFDRFRAYLSGQTDGVVKDANWAANLSDVPAEIVAELARGMAAGRTMLNASWSLQRADHGEQPFWMLIVLAAILGQIGLPGGGFTLGYAAAGSVGNGARRFKAPTLPQLGNPVASFIPVARIADMLLHPGEAFDYNGSQHTYPRVRVVYWAGGNPFHHHQDLKPACRGLAAA